MALFERLAVVTLRVGQSEKALLEEVAAGKSACVAKVALAHTYSFSFQKAKAMFWKPCESDTPAMPSSPQRKARDRAMSCVKSTNIRKGRWH